MLLWLTGAASALVFIEPSPYEVASLAAILVFMLSGLTLRLTLLPLVFLLILINIGYTISASELLGETSVLTWIVTSWYLAATAIFFAMMLCANTQARLDALLRGCLVAGLIAALAGIAGYFRLIPGSDELLLLYDRARGTFKDPNVFGAFLILPALLALQMIVAGRFKQAMYGMLLLGIFCDCSSAVVFARSVGAARFHRRPDIGVDLPHHAVGQSAPAHRSHRHGRRRCLGTAPVCLAVDGDGGQPVQAAHEP